MANCCMNTKRLGPGIFAVIVRLTLAVAGAAWLTSCSTAPPTGGGNAVFKFTVLRYKEPVPVSGWVFDPAQSANPEGAALNITICMQQGDVDKWLASWDDSERPSAGPAERAAWLRKWQPLKDGRVSLVGRVVAGAEVVIELSVLTVDQKRGRIQLPLKHAGDQWLQTAMDTNSEFLNWETSPNKILSESSTSALSGYLASVKAAQARQ